MSACRACRAPITWAVTVNDKAMPIDVAPAEGGNVRLTARAAGQAPLAEVLGPLDVAMAEDAAELHWPHHATCPNWPGGKR